MVVKTSIKRNIKKMLTVGMLIAGMTALAACKKEETTDSTRLAVSADKVSDNTDREKNNVLVTREDKNDKKKNVAITYKDNELTVESDINKVKLDDLGLHVVNGNKTVDITPGGIDVDEGDKKVEVSTKGIHIKDGKHGDTVDINLPEIQITNGEDGGTFPLSTFLNGSIQGIAADEEGNYDWLNFDNIDKLNLLDNTINVNGKRKNISVFIRDGYLVTKNCEEESTTVNGLTLEKSETDKEGNYYRYYKK